MEYKYQNELESVSITPRLIIHGGAGNILPSNLSPERYKAFHDSLLKILAASHKFLTSSTAKVGSFTSALDAVTFAVTLLEDDPLFNSGHGAVFTRDGINELEASVMVSKGSKKRGVGVMGLQHVKNPIKLAREMLLRGEQDMELGNGEAALGAQGHCQLHKASAEKLAEKWGLEMVPKEYFYTQNRWDEHLRGLEKEGSGKGIASWDLKEFLPQGTCGAVALDSEGVIAAATSTGGLTNKLTGRIGDTPTLGAGFWAEEWEEEAVARLQVPGPALVLSDAIKGLMADCLPSLTIYLPIPSLLNSQSKSDWVYRSTGMSGTGNGDSFLRLNVARTISAIARFRNTDLQTAVTEISGPDGEMTKSAGSRWKKTGEGEGGVIGIELTLVADANGRRKAAESRIVDDYNCGGMYRAAVDAHGKAYMRVWRPGQHPDLEKYDLEGRLYDIKDWLSA